MPDRDCFVALLLAMTTSGEGSCALRPEAREALPLPSRGVEIRRIEPALERAAQRRPVAVDHREPIRVAIASARQRRLPEQPLILKSEAQRRFPARHIERVAL